VGIQREHGRTNESIRGVLIQKVADHGVLVSDGLDKYEHPIVNVQLDHAIEEGFEVPEKVTVFGVENGEAANQIKVEGQVGPGLPQLGFKFYEGVRVHPKIQSHVNERIQDVEKGRLRCVEFPPQCLCVFREVSAGGKRLFGLPDRLFWALGEVTWLNFLRVVADPGVILNHIFSV
jgi:hypothetical protein